jgi:hypothetical protein
MSAAVGILRNILVTCTRQDFAVSRMRVERGFPSADTEDAGEMEEPHRATAHTPSKEL